MKAISRNQVSFKKCINVLSKKTKRKIVLAVCVLAAALVIVLIVQGVRGKLTSRE
jgi:predicted nucleic acid-binding Zn ribbon protein